jgi:hypothetical protein
MPTTRTYVGIDFGRSPERPPPGAEYGPGGVARCPCGNTRDYYGIDDQGPVLPGECGCGGGAPSPACGCADADGCTHELAPVCDCRMVLRQGFTQGPLGGESDWSYDSYDILEPEEEPDNHEIGSYDVIGCAVCGRVLWATDPATVDRAVTRGWVDPTAIPEADDAGDEARA